MIDLKEWKTRFTTKNGIRVVFRPEHSSDTEMFSTLAEESVSNLIPPFTRERVESWTSDIDYNKVLAIVAIINENNRNRIVGSASLKFNQQKALNHKAELGLTVHDDFQNIGIGTALLKHLVCIARKRRLKKIHLNVNTSNERAIYVYKKAGFVIEGRLTKESWINCNYRDEYRMALFL
jgi:putative acetyltransferase